VRVSCRRELINAKIVIKAQRKRASKKRGDKYKGARVASGTEQLSEDSGEAVNQYKPPRAALQGIAGTYIQLAVQPVYIATNSHPLVQAVAGARSCRGANGWLQPSLCDRSGSCRLKCCRFLQGVCVV
jgi:hypothetical protein